MHVNTVLTKECFQTTGKDDDREPVSPALKKRKAATSGGKTDESSASSGSPQYSRWLMKSEPESRFENGIDVKVWSSTSFVSAF